MAQEPPDPRPVVKTDRLGRQYRAQPGNPAWVRGHAASNKERGPLAENIRVRKSLARALRDAISEEQIAAFLVAVVGGREPPVMGAGDPGAAVIDVGDALDTHRPVDVALRLAALKMLLERRDGPPPTREQLADDDHRAAAGAQGELDAAALGALSDADLRRLLELHDEQLAVYGRARGALAPAGED